MTQTGGQLITAMLTNSGIRTVFALGGASHTHLLAPLDTAGVKIISSRHESGAVGGADGYARVTGQPGVALVIADQGLANAVPALAVAWHAASPVVVLVATPPRGHAEADRSIDQDQLALVAPISKWARSVPAAERLEDYLHTALKHARSGKPGPVVLLVPMEHLQADMSASAVSTPSPPPRPTADVESLRAAARQIAAAERPIIVVGGGAAWSDASDVLTKLSERFSLPVFANSLGRGQVAEDNERSFSWPYAQIAACQADVVLVVGARLTQRLGLGLPPRFAKDATFIQIDIDAGAMHRNRPTDIAIQADARSALQGLLETLIEIDAPAAELDWLHTALADRAMRVTELANRDTNPIHPLCLGREVMQRLPADVQLVGDGADIQNWMYGVLRVRRPRGFLDHYPMGAMGSCTALAVGAAAAHAEQHGADAPPTVLITGDGAIGFHPAEIHAAVRAGLKLIIIIGNDGAWGTERHGQLAQIGRTVNVELGTLPYHLLGEAFGATGHHVDSQATLGPALDNAFASSGVSVINVEIDREAGAEIKTNPAVRMIMFSDLLDGQASLKTLAVE